jgi:SAM-dependent methyltransferase
MKNLISIEQVLKEIFSTGSLIFAVLSSPRNSRPIIRITCRPLRMKNEQSYQITYHEKDKAFHKNLLPHEAEQEILTHMREHFKQGLLSTSSTDFHILVNKKNHMTILRKPPTQPTASLLHNRSKRYLLPEGEPIPFLVELGVMTREGKVIAKKSDKFKQINRFLEMVDDIIPHLSKEHPLQIIDFGCGKAYLTFALYHYLHLVKKYPLTLIGLDLKESVIVDCQQIAQRLSYEHLSFAVGDIHHYQPGRKVDMVITLHACDTATDAALATAVKWGADVILSVPCCQHELYQQVANGSLQPLLNHGILKERFAALATDAARALLLEIAGYQTQVLEFIDLEHTPKNLLIRSTRRSSNPKKDSLIKQYQEFKEALSITPSLEKMLEKSEEGNYSP